MLRANDAMDPRPRILLIEDDASFARALEFLMAPEYELETAPTGEAGLAAALLRKPDAVLMVIGLPDGDGLDAARAIRSALPGVPLVAVSGYAGMSWYARAADAGVDAYLVKPFSREDVVRTVDAQLKRAKR